MLHLGLEQDDICIKLQILNYNMKSRMLCNITQLILITVLFRFGYLDTTSDFEYQSLDIYFIFNQAIIKVITNFEFTFSQG